MKIVVFFSLFALFLISANPSVAQTAQSNAVRTKVGNPPIPETGILMIEAGLAIKTAYDTCAGGSTYEASGLGTCLRQSLSSQGYSDAILDAFETRRASGLADGCTQCVGYVGLILTLLSGSTATLTGVASAKDILNSSTITAGSLKFVQIPTSDPIQPGDIAVSGGGQYGHVALVNTVEGNVKFTMLESNGNFDCKITDSRSQLKELYSFYRQQ